jgi:SAM-dependent methyltransferase
MGLDFSEDFITEILADPEAYAGLNAHFRQADLSFNKWKNGLTPASFDLVLAFAVLHHIPGETNRRRLLNQIAPLLAPGGQFIHANWQFLNSPRLQARIQPWEAAGLSEEKVEPGDYLLDWRRGGRGLRYIHHFSEAELQVLAGETGFRVVDSFLSDGENGRLGLYQVWEFQP